MLSVLLRGTLSAGGFSSLLVPQILRLHPSFMLPQKGRKTGEGKL
uniref:Uncharacterized protein n=1 Tax=Rhizophora mucronata TaxID=61149 RepID=A0A2P2QIL3_RHIMU